MEMDKILPAIAAAIGQVSKLGKDNKNTHANYKFASIDDFLAMVNPICADNGLVFHMQESGIDEFNRRAADGKETPWFRMHYTITVYHVSGQSLPPVNRTVEVQRTGAQASGSAQSYCLKQFMRALFMIPTGDKDDADFREHGEGTVSRSAPAPTPTPPRISSAEMKRSLKVLDGQLTDVYNLRDLDALEGDWDRGMDKDGWPNPAPDSDDYEYSYRRVAKDKFKDRRAELERIAASQTEEEMA